MGTSYKIKFKIINKEAYIKALYPTNFPGNIGEDLNNATIDTLKDKFETDGKRAFANTDKRSLRESIIQEGLITIDTLRTCICRFYSNHENLSFQRYTLDNLENLFKLITLHSRCNSELEQRLNFNNFFQEINKPNQTLKDFKVEINSDYIVIISKEEKVISKIDLIKNGKNENQLIKENVQELNSYKSNPKEIEETIVLEDSLTNTKVLEFMNSFKNDLMEISKEPNNDIIDNAMGNILKQLLKQVEQNKENK